MIDASKDIQIESVAIGQERIWRICQQFYDKALYHIGFAMHLRGQFNIELMEKSINILIDRHESLRTVFSSINGKLKQIILPYQTIKITEINRQQIPLYHISDELKKIAHTEMLKRFDLQDGPLLRSCMIKFPDDNIGFILFIHHLISDGWSCGLLIYEISIIYRALTTNSKIVLSPQIAPQFRTYVHDQNHSIPINEFDPALLYWKNRLSNINNIEMNTRTNLDHERFYHHFSPQILHTLQKTCVRYQTSTFILLLLAFRLSLWLLHHLKYTIISVPTANRSHYLSQKTIGYFLNFVPVYLNIDENISFIQYIEKTSSLVKEDLKHSQIPIEYLSNYLNLDENFYKNPFYQILFAYQNYPYPSNIYNYEILELNDYFDMTEFGLSVKISNYKKTCEMEIIHSPTLYTHDFIQHFIEIFLKLIMEL